MESLPVELLLAIVETVACPITSFTSPSASSASRDLAALCGTSHRLHRIVTPFLYNSIECSVEEESHQLGKLCKTLQEAPGLRRHVKSIRYKPAPKIKLSPEQSKGRDSEQSKSCEDHEAQASTSMQRVAEALQLPQSDTFHWQMVEGNDIPLTLVVLQSPQLEDLRVSYAHVVRVARMKEPYLLEALVRTALKRPLGTTQDFQNLRVLHLDFGRYCYWPITTAVALTYLPCLDELTLGKWNSRSSNDFSIDNEEDNYVLGHKMVLPERECSPTKLALFHPAASPVMIAKLINACKTLTSFECASPIPKYEWFVEIAAALKKHSDTLERLSLGDKVLRFADNRGLSGFRPCKGLHRLSWIRLPLACDPPEIGYASSVGNLPTSVKFLFLDVHKSEEQGLEDYFSYFVDACLRGDFPRLGTVRLRFKYSTFNHLPIDFPKYTPLLDEVGIRLEALLWSDDVREDPEKGPSLPKVDRIKQLFPGHYDHWIRIENREDRGVGIEMPHIDAATVEHVGTRIELEEDYLRGY